MDFNYTQLDNLGIFKFNCELTAEIENDLGIVLMKAIYSIERAVLNLKNVTRIDHNCLQLIKKACQISIRLKRPLILTSIPEHYLQVLSQYKIENHNDYLINIVKTNSQNNKQKTYMGDYQYEGTTSLNRTC